MSEMTPIVDRTKTERKQKNVPVGVKMRVNVGTTKEEWSLETEGRLLAAASFQSVESFACEPRQGPAELVKCL